jgi:hypothetical protein
LSKRKSGKGDGRLEISPVTNPTPATMTTARARGGDLGKVSTFKKSHFMADSADFDAAPPL